jgi:hypothetical protein
VMGRTGNNSTGKFRGNRYVTLRSQQLGGEKMRNANDIGEPQNRNERRALNALKKKGQRRQKRRLADMDCSNLTLRGVK